MVLTMRNVTDRFIGLKIIPKRDIVFRHIVQAVVREPMKARVLGDMPVFMERGRRRYVMNVKNVDTCGIALKAQLNVRFI